MEKSKSAFTMIELVMIIVVVGIIAAAAIPRFSKNPLVEATHQIVSHIRYTQNLAMIDNEYNATDATWYQKQWAIVFDNTGERPYSVCRTSGGVNTCNQNWIASDPSHPSKLLQGGTGSSQTKTMLLKSKYDIDSVTLTCGNAVATALSFDYKGRPHQNLGTATSPSSNLVRTACALVLTNGAGQSTQINIAPESGMVSIDTTSSTIGSNPNAAYVE